MKKLLYTIALLGTLGVCLMTTAQDTTIRKAGGASASQITNSILASFNPRQFSTNGGIISVTNHANMTNLAFRDFVVGEVTGGLNTEFRFDYTNSFSPTWLFAATNSPSILLYSSNITGGATLGVDAINTNLNISVFGNTIATLNGDVARPNSFYIGDLFINVEATLSDFRSVNADSAFLSYSSINNSMQIGEGGNATGAKSRVETYGSFGHTVTTIEGTTTLNNANHIVYVITATSAATINLPAVSTCTGREYVIKDKSANALVRNITIDPNGAETIDGAATYVININSRCVIINNDGTNWFKLSVSP
jgi:hypothetical protein